MTAQGFDLWRKDYQTLSSDVHARMYSECYARDPKHASFSGRAVRVFLNQIGGRPAIAEIGGRNGSLARAALESTPAIRRWVNYDICPGSMAASATADPRYEARLMTDFRWWRTTPIEGEALVMSHVLEHLSDNDAKEMIRAIPGDIRAVHVQAPIAMRGPTDWTGFNGAHILSMGWMEIDDLFDRIGFRSTTAYDGATWVRR